MLGSLLRDLLRCWLVSLLRGLLRRLLRADGSRRTVVKLGVGVWSGLRSWVHREAIMSWRRARRGRRVEPLVRLAIFGHDDAWYGVRRYL